VDGFDRQKQHRTHVQQHVDLLLAEHRAEHHVAVLLLVLLRWLASGGG